MKKYFYLFLGCFMVFIVSSCGSNEEDEGPAVGCEIIHLINNDEVYHLAQDGDTLFVHTTIDAELCYATTDRVAATSTEHEKLSPEIMKWLYKETLPEEGATFHWLTIKQESPSKYMFIVNSKDLEEKPEWIFVFFWPTSGGTNSSYWAHFQLE